MTIAARFRFEIASVALTGLALLAADQAWLSRRMMERGLERRAVAIGDSVAEFSARELRAGRVPLAAALQSFADLQGVRFLGLYDPTGAPIVELRPSVPVGREDVVRAFSSPLGAEDEAFGTVRLRMSEEHIDSATLRIAAHGFVLSVLVVTLVAGTAGFLGGRLGGYLERFAASLKAHGPLELPPIPPRFVDSELEAIENAFRSFSADLIREQALREELSRQKEEMASMLVHDLKHPLTVLNTILMIEKDPDLAAGSRGRRDEHFRMASRALARLSGMIEDILHIARLREGKGEVAKELVGWDRFLDDAEEESRLIVEAAGRTFKVRREAAVGGLRSYANVLLLKRLIGNLVLNAIENSPKGAEVTLGAGLSSQHPGRIAVWVRNSGSVIPESHRRLVFERFFTSGRSEHNVGLGLSFCKLAADAHGAVLSVSSEADGTQFTLALSYVAGPPAVEGAARAEARTGPGRQT